MLESRTTEEYPVHAPHNLLPQPPSPARRQMVSARYPSSTPPPPPPPPPSHRGADTTHPGLTSAYATPNTNKVTDDVPLRLSPLSQLRSLTAE